MHAVPLCLSIIISRKVSVYIHGMEKCLRHNDKMRARARVCVCACVCVCVFSLARKSLYCTPKPRLNSIFKPIWGKKIISFVIYTVQICKKTTTRTTTKNTLRTPECDGSLWHSSATEDKKSNQCHQCEKCSVNMSLLIRECCLWQWRLTLSLQLKN